jgi:lysozyme family protein
MEFEEAFAVLMKFEGGYSNDPKDPGGETKYGISKRAYPDEDITNLTEERAKEIYKKDYWNKVKGDTLPAQLRYAVFDAAVNSGVTQAIKWLQASVAVVEDGKLGTETMKAVKACVPYQTAATFCGYRIRFITKIPTFPTFGKGLCRRVSEILIRYV